MAVLKYKNSNGEYVAIPTGIPSQISAFENDCDYQTREQVEDRIARPAEWSGLWVEDREFGINLADGLEITPDNHLRTESWLIPHDNGSVGDAIENMRMEIQGVRFISLLGCENVGWIDNCVIGDCLPANDEQFIEEVFGWSGFEANIHINGEGFGRGFSVWLEKQGESFIGGFEEDFEFERVELDPVNHKLRLYCRDWCNFIGQPVHNFELQLIEVSRPVKEIDTAEGLWQDVENGGQFRRIGLDTDYIIGLIEENASGQEVDLSNYYTQTEIKDLFKNTEKFNLNLVAEPNATILLASEQGMKGQEDFYPGATSGILKWDLDDSWFYGMGQKYVSGEYRVVKGNYIYRYLKKGHYYAFKSVAEYELFELSEAGLVNGVNMLGISNSSGTTSSAYVGTNEMVLAGAYLIKDVTYLYEESFNRAEDGEF